MGVIDAGLGAIEDGWEKGKKAVGEGIDKGTDAIGGGLDKVGLHDAADAVEDFGDDVAANLGATPGEKGLGETEEANELVRGKPDKIRDSAKHLKDFHRAFDQVGDGMRKVDSSGWAGEAADAFEKKFDVHPKKWLHAADACETAGKALESYATTVTWAQGQAREAIDLYKKGRKASEDAVRSHNDKVDAYNTKVEAQEDPGPKPGPFNDPGKADVRAAHEKLNSARKQRNSAASDAQRAVKDALVHAPEEPSATDRLRLNGVDEIKGAGLNLSHVAGGLLKGTGGLVGFARGLNPLDPYNLTHPAEFIKNGALTLTGLVSTAAHPERAAAALLDGLRKDPAEFIGRLGPELLGGKGIGATKAATRAANAARKAAGDKPQIPSRRPCDKTCKKDPVDVATGHMVLPQTDLALPGSLPLLFRRHFDSSYRLGRWFGPGWSTTVDQHLEIDSTGVMFVGEDGIIQAYPHPAQDVPTLASHGPRRPLELTDDGYTLTDPETGRTCYFALRSDELAVLDQISDRNGNHILFEYDEEGAPRSLVHSGGYHLRLETDTGRVTALYLKGAGPNGGDQCVMRYGYEDGNLTQVINSSGRPLKFGYDDLGRMVSWTDTNNSRFTYTYDDQDRCVSQTGEAGHMRSTFAYSEPDPETGESTTVITNTDGQESFLINDRCQVIAETDGLGNTTRFEFDHYNRLLSRTDPLGRTTTFEYDDDGNLLRRVRPDGRESRAEYNAFGLPTLFLETDGSRFRQEYDDDGNLSSVTVPEGHTVRYARDGNGNVAEVTDLTGAVTRVRSNTAGLPVEVTDPLGAITRYAYDAFGRTVTVTDPLGATTFLDWSPEGKLLRSTAPDGTAESWTYDGEGNCLTHTDAQGGTTRFEYTHFDLLTARTGPDGVRYEFAHDSELRLTQVTNPHGLSWNYEFDAAGRLITETDFDDRVQCYEHDAASQLTARVNPLGQRITFDRNTLGQVLRKDADGKVTTYAYDFTDQLAEATNPDAALTVMRDRHGRVVTETVAGRELRYHYDEYGRRNGRTTPGGAHSTWTYDATGRRAELTTSGHRLQFSRDAAGREISRLIDGTLALDHAYDVMGRRTAQRVATAGSVQQQRDYHYRADGNLIRIDDTRTGTRTFDLDTNGRVTAVNAHGWHESYAYDAAGNQTHAQWPDGHPSGEARGERAYEGTRITRAGRIRYEYDQAGRTTVRQKSRLSKKPDTWRYTWDAEDRMTSVITPDGTLWRYEYDALARRTAKLRIADDGQTVAERVDFTWDGTTLCEQTTHTPLIPHPVTLTWDHDGHRPLTQTETLHDQPSAADAPQDEINRRFYAITTDLVGTPTELHDPHGNLAWHTQATLWGTTTWSRNATTYTPLRFPGQYFDPETGLHQNYFRYYSPENTRYSSPDPLGLPPSPDPLSYAYNPLEAIDPTGLSPCTKGEVAQDFGVHPKAVVNPRQVYRGDARDPRTVFGEGFHPKGANEDIGKYALHDTPSNWVGTSKSASEAANFPQSAKGRGTWVYEVRGAGYGVDVNKSLGGAIRSWIQGTGFPSEREVIFRGIDPSTIVRAERWSYGRPTGEVIENPGYSQ